MIKFLFYTLVEGTRFIVKALPGQQALTDYLDSEGNLQLSGPVGKLARFGVNEDGQAGPVFACTDFSPVDDGHLLILAYQPLFHNEDGESLAASAGDQALLTEAVELLLTLPGYGEERTRQLAAAWEEQGYAFDWDTLTAAPPLEEAIQSGGLRKTVRMQFPCPKEEDCGFHVDPATWEVLVRNVLRQENTLLTGPTGTGKTEVISLLARRMGLELFTLDMGTVQDPQSAMIGVHRLNAQGVSVFDPAPFVRDVQKPGIHLLDEVNRGPESANSIIFPATDARRYVPVDIAGDHEQRLYRVHPEHAFLATANLGSDYTGTRELDRAFNDRFPNRIEMDYPAEAKEIHILRLRTGIDEKSATAIVRVAGELRKQYRSQDLSASVSMRHTLCAAGYVYDGFDLLESLEIVFIPLFEDGEGVTERSKVRTVLAAY
jgi:MoxR-like ATPase